MHMLIDLTNIVELEKRRIEVRDRLAHAKAEPWTPAMVHLEDGRSFSGSHLELCWLVGEPLVDSRGTYLPDLQFLRLTIGPTRILQSSLKDVRAIELANE
jgi:hypothetical protein